MKKLISMLCALTMISGMGIIAQAEESASLTLDAYYMDEDWETMQDKVIDAGDIIAVTVKAENFPSLEKLPTTTDVLSNINFKIEYDASVITPYLDGHIDTTTYEFVAKYSNPKANKPTADTEGYIYLTGKAPTMVSNVDEPGYVPNGVTSFSATGATSGFAINGDFVAFYFLPVVDEDGKAKLKGDPEIKLTVNNVAPYDTEEAKFDVAGSTFEIAGISSGSDAPSIVKKEVVVTPVKGNANAEGKFTQAFKASITGNGETVTTVNFILSNGSKEWKSADNGKGWTGLKITGATPVTFGVNVLNVPSDATVTAEFIAE